MITIDLNRLLELWKPWRDFEAQSGRAYDEPERAAGVAEGAGYPPISVWTSNEAIIVAALVPGATPESLELSVSGQVLQLAGLVTAAPGDAEVKLRERQHGRFERQIALPCAVDEQGIEADYRHGVLQVILPRAAADRPIKIKVQAK
jgi:HSP20 family protein